MVSASSCALCSLIAKVCCTANRQQNWEHHLGIPSNGTGELSVHDSHADVWARAGHITGLGVRAVPKAGGTQRSMVWRMCGVSGSDGCSHKQDRVWVYCPIHKRWYSSWIVTGRTGGDPWMPLQCHLLPAATQAMKGCGPARWSSCPISPPSQTWPPLQ